MKLVKGDLGDVLFSLGANLTRPHPVKVSCTLALLPSLYAHIRILSVNRSVLSSRGALALTFLAEILRRVSIYIRGVKMTADSIVIPRIAFS